MEEDPSIGGHERELLRNVALNFCSPESSTSVVDEESDEDFYQPMKRSKKDFLQKQTLGVMSTIHKQLKNRDMKKNNSVIAFGNYVASELAEMSPEDAKIAKMEIVKIICSVSK